MCIRDRRSTPPAALLLLVFLRLKGERSGVHAIALAGGLGTVGEDVTQMRIAARAQHFGAPHEEAAILLERDGFFRHRRPEARPARAGIVFRRRFEQRRAAADAAIEARLLVVPMLAGERPLGAVLARDVILLGRQLFFPLGIALHDLV